MNQGARQSDFHAFTLAKSLGAAIKKIANVKPVRQLLGAFFDQAFIHTMQLTVVMDIFA